MDALKKADAAKEPEISESDSSFNDTKETVTDDVIPSALVQESEPSVTNWDNELLSEFENHELAEQTTTANDSGQNPEQINEPILLNSLDVKEESGHSWDDEFLPEFKHDTNDLESDVIQTSNANLANENNTEEQQFNNFVDVEPIQPVSTHPKQNFKINFPIGETKPLPDIEITELPNETEQENTLFHQPEDAQRVLAASTSVTSSRRTFWLIVLVGVLFAGIGGGYYVYLQSSLTQPLVFNIPPPMVSLQPPTSNQVVTQLPPTNQVTNSPLASKPSNKEPVPPVKSKKITPLTENITPKKSTAVHKSVPLIEKKPSKPKLLVKPHVSARPTKPKQTPPVKVKQAQETLTNPNIHTLRKTVLPKVNKDLSKGYTAWQRGDKSAAHKAYSKALRQEANNRDALLGLAALAWQNGNRNKAQQYYQQILLLNPQDSHAKVGLINTLSHHSPKSESQLKLLLKQAPQSAHIHFTLGNLYATSGRWNQAQQAYFEALRYDNKQADYAYNLAVSLEHIEKPRLALSYYQKALQLSAKQHINFDNQVARKRIQTLLIKTRPSALANLPLSRK